MYFEMEVCSRYLAGSAYHAYLLPLLYPTSRLILLEVASSSFLLFFFTFPECLSAHPSPHFYRPVSFPLKFMSYPLTHHTPFRVWRAMATRKAIFVNNI